MKRSELSEDKQKEYDSIIAEIMQDIESQNPDQYLSPNQLDGQATKIYQETFDRYRPRLEKLFV